MSKMDKDNLLRAWKDVLSYQTMLFGPEEANVLQQWDFGDSQLGVLDAGCGDGEHGLFLAKKFPNINFYGLDSNKEFVDEFRRKKSSYVSNYSIYKCNIATDPIPSEIAGKFDQCLIRLVLQHTASPVSVLQSIFDVLPTGGRIFIIEEDDGFFKIYPDCPAFYDVVKMWKTVCNYSGSARYIGREIPELLTKSGFTVKKAKALLHSNFEVGSGLMDYLVSTVRLLQTINPNLVAGDEPRRIAQEFNEYLDKYGNSWFAVYPQVIAMGVKP